MSGFDDFWNAYPRKEAKSACLKKWQQKKLDSMASTIVAHVEKRAKKDKKWKAGYVPMPLTFLSQERWTDEYEEIPEPRLPPAAAPEVHRPPPQPCHYKAVINLAILDIVKRNRGVPEDTLRNLVRERNRMASQMREMWGNEPVQSEWKDLWPGFVKGLNDVAAKTAN